MISGWRTGGRVVVALVFGLAAGFPPARAATGGVIRGRVDLGRREAPVLPTPSVDALGGADPAAEHPMPSRSVVYLESGPLGAFEQPAPGHAVMDQRHETFVPHVLAVTMGTTVDFPNSDRIYHNVFSLSKPHPFDLGRYAVGHSKSVRFDRPGIVRVFCDIHSHMNAFILVFSHRFFSVTDAAGRYRIEGVPPGAYDVIAWNEGTLSPPRSVVVTAGGATDVNFVFP